MQNPDPPSPSAPPIRRRTVTGQQGDLTLIDFVAAEWRLSRRQAKRVIDDRRVFVNDRRIWIARYRLHPGDAVEMAGETMRAPAAEAVPILYDDGQVVVADKPANLETVGEDGLEGRLRRQLACPELVAAHRLDKQTTGCVILARQAEVKVRLIEQFRARDVVKNYRAVVVGRLPRRPRTINTPLDGKAAVTRVRVLKATDEASYLAVGIETGRKHQIRRHLAGIRHPVVGDHQYLTGPLRSHSLRAVPRPLLHACSLQFQHPDSGRPIRARAELPGDFRSWLNRLGLG